MITIILPISRKEYLTRVITSLELLECRPEDVNILAIVDGDDALFTSARNLVGGLKFNRRLIVKSRLKGSPPRLDILQRRRRIASIHNHAREILDHDDGYVFLVEDDTTFGTQSLQKLMKVASTNSAFGMAIGVEVARWGVPYVGAWTADDVYEPTTIKSVNNETGNMSNITSSKIDAGGLYCALVRTSLYKSHEFNFENGLGPDVNFGLAIRRLGYDNFMLWDVPCIHYNNILGEEIKITPYMKTKQVTLTKKNESKWNTSY